VFFGENNTPKGAICGPVAEDVLKVADLSIMASDERSLVIWLNFERLDPETTSMIINN